MNATVIPFPQPKPHPAPTLDPNDWLKQAAKAATDEYCKRYGIVREPEPRQ